MSRYRATKAEQKVLAKLQRSAAAVHLYEGLFYTHNYEAHEAARYWRTYKHEPFELGDVAVFQRDTTLASLEELLLEHNRNIRTLEDQLVTELANNPTCDCEGTKTGREYCSCPCHDWSVIEQA